MLQERFSVSYSAPYSSYKPYNMGWYHRKAQMPIDVGIICRTCKGCRAHSRDTKVIPVVPRLALVSYISVPSIMVRLERYLKAPQSIISLSCTFFETPCTFLNIQVLPEVEIKVKYFSISCLIKTNLFFLSYQRNAPSNSLYKLIEHFDSFVNQQPKCCLYSYEKTGVVNGL